MTREISITFLLKILKSAWWIMLIAAIVIGSAAAAFTEFAVAKKYQSTVEFYILNTSTTSEYMTTSLLASAEYLANDYIQIIKSDQVIDAILEKLGESGYDTTKTTHASIRNMLSSSIADNSSTFNITVTSTSPDIAYIVACAIRDEAPEIIRSITRPSYTSSLYTYTDTNRDGAQSVDEFKKLDEQDLECVKPVRQPQKATSPSSPNVLLAVMVSAILAACAVYMLVFLHKQSDTTVRSEKILKELLDPSITVIGTIPYWSTHSNEKKG